MAIGCWSGVAEGSGGGVPDKAGKGVPVKPGKGVELGPPGGVLLAGVKMGEVGEAGPGEPLVGSMDGLGCGVLIPG